MESLIPLAIVLFAFGGGIWMVWKRIKNRGKPQPEKSGSNNVTGKFVCTSCETVSNGKRRVKGSIFIELILWCCFIIPGVIYSIWRHTTAGVVCPTCGGDSMVPAKSPAGQRIIASHV